MKNDDLTVEDSLSGARIHDAWEASYRTARNERFYEKAFERVLNAVGAPEGARFLDVGCGPGYHSMRLARHGYDVLAADFSPAAGQLARRNIADAGLSDRITVVQEDLRGLSFSDQSVPYILCWGVLMHVPEVQRAVAELSRVLAEDGVLIVCEGNVDCLDNMLVRLARRLRGTPHPGTMTKMGSERWKETPVGPLLTRSASIPWLINEFTSHGLSLTDRMPGQLSEAYVKLGDRFLGAAVHGVNDLALRIAPAAQIAAGNVLLFTRTG